MPGSEKDRIKLSKTPCELANDATVRGSASFWPKTVRYDAVTRCQKHKQPLNNLETTT